MVRYAAMTSRLYTTTELNMFGELSRKYHDIKKRLTIPRSSMEWGKAQSEAMEFFNADVPKLLKLITTPPEKAQ